MTKIWKKSSPQRMTLIIRTDGTETYIRAGSGQKHKTFHFDRVSVCSAIISSGIILFGYDFVRVSFCTGKPGITFLQ